jgi:ATP-dependent DNA helicase RecQ
VFVHGFDPPNLRLRMQAKTPGREEIGAFVRTHLGQSGIVYCGSRRKTEEIAHGLRQIGADARPYQAGLDPQVRSRHQDMFRERAGVVMVATIAFGLGSTSPTCATCCTPTCPPISRATTTRSGAPAAMACRPTR